jgi:hypothetical protein
LSNKHKFWPDTSSTSKEFKPPAAEDELFELYQESLKKPLDIHYNEINIGNYKYFGTRKLQDQKLPDLKKTIDASKTSGTNFRNAASVAGEKEILSGQSINFDNDTFSNN